MIEGIASLEELAHLVVQAVLNGLWRALLVTLAVAAGMAFLRRKSAATRHLIWAATLLVVVILPIAAAWLGGDVSRASAAPAAPAAPAIWTAEPPIAQVASQAGATEPRWLIELSSGPWLVPLFGLGVLVAGLRLARLLRGLRRVRGLKRASRPLASRFAARLEELRDRHVHRSVELKVSDRIGTPLTLGFARPVVVLPERLVEELTEDELAQVVLHELAHIRRHDHWSNLAQRAIEAVFFFHPVVLWIGKRLELERELACDEYAVAHSGGKRAYAHCLTRLAELAVTSPASELAPAAISRRSQLSRRVRALLASDRPPTARISSATCASFVAGVVAASFALAQVAPVLCIRVIPRGSAPVSNSSPPAAPATASLAIRASAETSDRAHLPTSQMRDAAAGRAAAATAGAADPVRQTAPAQGSGDATDRLPRPAVVAGPAAGAQWALHGSRPDLGMAAGAGEQPGCAAGGAGADECATPATPLAADDDAEVAHGDNNVPDASSDAAAASNRNRGGIRIDIAVAVPFLPGARPVRAAGRPYPGGMPAMDYNTPVGDMIDAIRGEPIGAARVGGIRLSVRGNRAWGSRGAGTFAPW